jgi:cytochrome c
VPRPLLIRFWLVAATLGAFGALAPGGCDCDHERAACTRDGDCADQQVCYTDQQCVPRDVAVRAGGDVGDECVVLGGEEIGCDDGLVCRMGYCGDGGPGGVDAPVGPAVCTEGTTSNPAPLFGGVISATADGADAVVLVWSPAADDTLPEAIRYKVFVAGTPDGHDFTAPVASVVGLTTFRVEGLTTDATYHFVVRAEDEAGQVECNTNVQSATPRPLGACVSYADNIKPILDTYCTSCHRGAGAPRNLHLDTYAGVLAGGLTGTEVVSCQAEASLIFLKVSMDNPPVGQRMPQGGPYLSTSQIELFRRWIDGGAVETCAGSGPACDDMVAPTFAGLTSATLTGASTARLCWGAGSDDVTAPGALLYDLYQATTPGGQGFASPPVLTSAAGATCADVSGLTPAQQYCWVARARDGAGNRDGNTVERCLTTAAATCIDYATVIQPIFNAECTQCHAGASPPRGLSLTSHAGVIAGGQTGNEVVACQPTSSLLYQKVALATPPVGVRMPADGPPYLTTAQIGAIEQWIAEGGRASCAAPDPCSDASPPTFAGVTSATSLSPTSVRLCWAAGADNLTPASGLLYDAYLAASPGGQNYTVGPRKTSPAGATCVQIDALPPDSQHCWVVRARDGAGNRDGNTVERCVSTPAVPAGCVDYATMIQPLLDHNCTRCHAGARPPQWLRLDNYDHVLAGSVRRNEVVACNPGASLLVDKISASPSLGKRMPYDGPPYLTASQEAMVAQWISTGARRVCSEPVVCGDTQAPSFVGASSAVATDPTTIRVCWPQASDAVTPAASLRYDVYQAANPGGESYALPPQDSVVGSLCTDVRVGPSSTTCFVVRARDLAGNRSTNNLEVCASTAAAACAVDYDALVQPILTARCTHCHQGDRSSPRFLDLRTYGGVLAGGSLRDAADACDWAGSLLNTKTAAATCGNRMPFDGPPWLAASERSLLKSWIDAGARRTCTDGNPCGDSAAPAFAGIRSATATSPTETEVCWNAATDAGTGPDGLVYEIFDGPSAAGINVGRPAPYAAAGGATCTTIPVPTGQATCFVVRARDLAGNRDGNTVARCATPGGACFGYDDTIQPVFDARCVHCHSGGNPPRGIRWDSYAHTIGNDEVEACNPGGSKLNRVVEDCEMPFDTTSGSCRACLTSTQTRLLRQWVGGGAEASCPWGGC